MLFANADAKQTAFQTVLAEATNVAGTKSPCDKAGDWVTYTETQVKFYDDLVKAPSDYMDADLMSLAGRIQAASKNGEQGLLMVNPRLLARKDEVTAMREKGPAQYSAWVDSLINGHKGQRVWVLGTMSSVHALALQLLQDGTEAAFAPDSMISVGSGFPDGEPAGWRSRRSAGRFRHARHRRGDARP